MKRLRDDPRRPEIRNILIKNAIYLYALSLQKAACEDATGRDAEEKGKEL